MTVSWTSSYHAVLIYVNARILRSHPHRHLPARRYCLCPSWTAMTLAWHSLDGWLRKKNLSLSWTTQPLAMRDLKPKAELIRSVSYYTVASGLADTLHFSWATGCCITGAYAFAARDEWNRLSLPAPNFLLVRFKVRIQLKQLFKINFRFVSHSGGFYCVFSPIRDWMLLDQPQTTADLMHRNDTYEWATTGERACEVSPIHYATSSEVTSFVTKSDE